MGRIMRPASESWGGGEADGVEAGEFGLGDGGGDGVSGAGERDEEDADEVGAERDSGRGGVCILRVDGLGVDGLGVDGLGVDDEDDAEEAEEDSGDGAAFGLMLHDDDGEEQRPDGGGGVDDGRDAAGDGALADGEEDEGDGVVEEGDEEEPGEKPARRQGAATREEHGPEEGPTPKPVRRSATQMGGKLSTVMLISRNDAPQMAESSNSSRMSRSFTRGLLLVAGIFTVYVMLECHSRRIASSDLFRWLASKNTIVNFSAKAQY